MLASWKRFYKSYKPEALCNAQLKRTPTVNAILTMLNRQHVLHGTHRNNTINNGGVLKTI